MVKNGQRTFNLNVKVSANEVEKVDLDRKMIEDKVRYFLDVDATFTNQLLDKSTFVYSKTHRVRNVLSSDVRSTKTLGGRKSYVTIITHRIRIHPPGWR